MRKDRNGHQLRTDQIHSDCSGCALQLVVILRLLNKSKDGDICATTWIAGMRIARHCQPAPVCTTGVAGIVCYWQKGGALYLSIFYADDIIMVDYARDPNSNYFVSQPTCIQHFRQSRLSMLNRTLMTKKMAAPVQPPTKYWCTDTWNQLPGTGDAHFTRVTYHCRTIRRSTLVCSAESIE
jgi:hypothetical protein